MSELEEKKEITEEVVEDEVIAEVAEELAVEESERDLTLAEEPIDVKATDEMIIEPEKKEFKEAELVECTPDDILNDTMEEEYVTEEPPVEIVRTLKTITPIRAYMQDKVIKGNPYKVANVSFICKDSADIIFYMSKNYILNIDQEIRVSSLPFYDSNNFVNQKIVASILAAGLDNYITSFKFSVSENYNYSEDPYVVIDGYNTSTRQHTNIYIPAEQFACIAYIDSYISDDITNEHDLALATVAGSKTPNEPTKFFVVNKVESIAAVVPAIATKPGLFEKLKRKLRRNTTTSYGVVAKLSGYDANNNVEFAYILMPMDLDTVFDKDKYKGKTVEDVEEQYYGESDQYISTLLVPTIKLSGAVDKEFMMVRGKNKDANAKVFLLDNSIKEELVDAINKF